MAVIKNTVEPNILGSIGECDSATEYLEKIKNQFTGSSKTYATQIIEQLVTKRYYGGAGTIRDHIMGMSALNSKLKPMDLDLKEEFLVHLVFASLPKEFCNICCKLQLATRKVEHGKGNSIVKQIVTAT